VSGATFILHSEADRQMVMRQVARMPLRWVVRLEEQRRSQIQNDKMWAMLTDVARAKPQGRVWTPEQWKPPFMDACDHKPIYGENLEGDGFLCLGYKSSRLTKPQFSDLIECIYEYGARHDVRWSEASKRERA
jgi:hypothetical protein